MWNSRGSAKLARRVLIPINRQALFFESLDMRLNPINTSLSQRPNDVSSALMAAERK